MLAGVTPRSLGIRLELKLMGGDRYDMMSKTDECTFECVPVNLMICEWYRIDIVDSRIAMTPQPRSNHFIKPLFLPLGLTDISRPSPSKPSSAPRKRSISSPFCVYTPCRHSPTSHLCLRSQSYLNSRLSTPFSNRPRTCMVS